MRGAAIHIRRIRLKSSSPHDRAEHRAALDAGACRQLESAAGGEVMQKRIVLIGAAIAAVALALMVTRTAVFAASDKESCSTTDTNVGRMAMDGTGVSC